LKLMNLILTYTVFTMKRIAFFVCLIVLSSISNIVVAQDISFFELIRNGEISEIEAELQKGVDIEKPDSRGDTAVLIAARGGRLDVLRLLVGRGANINALDVKKRDVINIAITTKNVELARVALELGADPAMVTSIYDGGAIIYGSAKGAVKIVDMLIEAGAPVNRVNNIGWTALLEVAILGDGTEDYITIATALIEAGADKTIKDSEGKSAFDHASLRGHEQLAQVLKF